MIPPKYPSKSTKHFFCPLLCYPIAENSANPNSLILIAPVSCAKLGKCPVLVIQRANGSGLEPPLNTVQVERVATLPPRSNTVICRIVNAVGLALDARFHQVVAANGTRFHNNIPQPKGNRRPFLDFKSRFLFLLNLLTRLVVDLDVVVIHGGVEKVRCGGY